MQACETCVGLLGANRFCQVFSQKPHSGFVTLPSLQQGWRGWTGTQGPRRGWRSGWSARGRKKREGEGGGGGWGDWNWNMSWVEQRGAKPERQPASEVTRLHPLPRPTTTPNHPPEGPEWLCLASEGSAGRENGGMQAAEILFSVLFPPDFGVCVYQAAQSHSKESLWKLT